MKWQVQQEIKTYFPAIALLCILCGSIDYVTLALQFWSPYSCRTFKQNLFCVGSFD